MIKKHVLLSILGLFIACTVGAQDNPMADEKAIVKSGNMRFTVLTPEMIRIEYSAKLQFEDRASFVVINHHLPVPNFTQEERDGYLYLTTDKLELRYKLGTYPVSNDRCNPNLQITLDVNGVEEVWYPGKQDPYNLKGTTRTLDRAEGDVREWLENGLLSRVGWAVIDEREPRKDGSLSLMFERDTNGGMDWVAQRKDTAALDMYFMGYGHDYKKALGDFSKIAGKIPLPPLYVFGYWYSKFQRYTEQDMRDIVNEIRSRDIPMDILVIDMDWHRNGKTGSTDGTEWTGWSWNKALFPDPAGFISWLHDEQNLNTTLNLHPADGIFPKEDNYDALYADLAGRYSDIKADSLANEDGTIRWNIENKDFYEAFFEHILRPHENIGVGFWWVDWQQWMIAQNEPNLGNTFWLNHVFFNDKKLQAKNRPFIFHRWGGLGNHRYPIGFSGDSEATFSSLAFQPYFTATASNVGYGYWSHDIGGHQGVDHIDPELYVRFLLRTEDVTKRVLSAARHAKTETERRVAVDSIMNVIGLEVSEKDSTLTGIVDAYYAGNEFWLSVYRDYNDVRLVFAPPSSVGKFGWDTDNWMWPRHTGDFSVFRIYANTKNGPADYSPENVPYHPEYVAPISLDGYKEGSFCMTLGYPGSTERYLSSYGIEEMMNGINQAMIDVRGVKQTIWKREMDRRPDIRIKYASKYDESSNYWKNSIGTNKAIKHLKVLEKKRVAEAELRNWIQSHPEEREKLIRLFSSLELSYSNRRETNRALAYFGESFINGPELVQLALEILNFDFEAEEKLVITRMKKLLEKYDNQ